MIDLYTNTNLEDAQPLLKYNGKIQYGSDAVQACIYNGTIFTANNTKANTPKGIFDATKFNKLSGGLRLNPVANEAELKALGASNYSQVFDTNAKREYVFKPTADLTPSEDADTNNIADNAGTGKWIYQIMANTHKSAILDTIMSNSSMKDHPDYMSMQLGTPFKNEGGFREENKDGHPAIVFPRDGTFEITNYMTVSSSDTISGTGYKNQRFSLYLYRNGVEIRKIDDVEVKMDDNGQTAYPRLHGIVDVKAGDYLRTLSGGSNGYTLSYLNRKIVIKQMTESVVEKTPMGKYTLLGEEHDTGDVDDDGNIIYRQKFRLTTYADTELIASGVKEYFGFDGRYKYNGTAVRSMNYAKTEHTVGEVYSNAGKLHFRKTDTVDNVNWVDLWIDYTKV